MANTAEKTFRNQLREELPTLISDKLYRLAQSWVGAEVAVERERCAKEDPKRIPCPTCSAAVNSECRAYSIAGWRYQNSHDERWRAAIRTTPERSA